jgi:hypothetical protein
MRRPRIFSLLALLAALTSLIAGCRQEPVSAGSVTVVPAATPVATATPRSTQPSARTPAPTETPLVDTSDSADSDEAVQAVSALLQRRVPTLPARPLQGPTPNRGRRTDPVLEGEPGIVLPTPTPTTESAIPRTSPGAESAEVDGVVNASVVNIRSGPGTVYAVAGQVRQGDRLTLAGRNEDATWLKICCPVNGEEEAWVAADFLDVMDDLRSAVPVVEAPPTPEPAVAAAAVSAPAPGSGSGPGLPGPGNFPAPGGTNPLTGQPLSGARSGQRPIIVCINNDFAARPQLGTSQADVMYEYLMEGYGITRFSGVYYGQPSGQIGPVRSARLINYYMGALYDAGLVCSGASDRVRYMLKHEAPFPYLDIDLDDPSNARYSVSIGSDYRTRLRTATDKLRLWLADWGVEKPASIRGFTFGDAPGGGAPATSINIPYPNGQASYRYDGGSGRYLRSMSGGAHVDGNTGAQLGLDNVIVQFVPHQATDIVEDSLGSTSIRLNLFGTGRAIVFRDGQAFEGTWRSESRGDTPRFYDGSGAEVPLKPGKSWISVVPVGYGVTYQ